MSTSVNKPVDLPNVCFVLAKHLKCTVKQQKRLFAGDDFTAMDVDLADAANRVLSLPTVASKNFLITIGDRSITGMVARDQMGRSLASACGGCWR